MCTVDYSVTQKAFNFPKKHNLPFYFVSASDGTNVVKVHPIPSRSHIASPCRHVAMQVFTEAIKAGVDYKSHSTDYEDQVLELLHEV